MHLQFDFNLMIMFWIKTVVLILKNGNVLNVTRLLKL